MTALCEPKCDGCATPCEFEDLKPTRDNVRACVKGFKVVKAMVEDDLDLLESIHTQYMEKKGGKKRTRQFNAVRKALNDLLEGMKEDRL